MSKEITYLNVNVWVGYLTQLAALARGHKDALEARGLAKDVPAKLEKTSEALQDRIHEYLQSQMKTNAEGEETRIARARLNEWMSLIKDAARLTFRDAPNWVLVKHDLRIGVAYQTRRVANVLAEAQAMLPGVEKHAKALRTRLTAAELAEGEALIAALAAERFDRVGALNEQLEARFERDAVLEEGRKLAQEVLDAVELAFREGDPIRGLFFELDERLSTAQSDTDAPEPAPEPEPTPA